MKLQTQLFGSSLKTEKSRMVWGGRFFLFSFSSFQDPSVEDDALIYALELQLGSCTVLSV